MDSTPKKKLSLLSKGLLIHIGTVLSFSVIYQLYTSIIADDFNLQRDTFVDTQVNCMLLASFVSAGSFPSNFEHSSSLSRLILIINVLISSLSKVWLITVED
tara:strand:- start:819 stop:1124 length:306 start_codon:yes stop_codon:yes gene_type:complete